MVSIRKATVEDIPLIQKIAFETWPHVYEKIISREQINYMLDLFYSEAVLLQSMVEKQQHFLLIFDGEKPCGFAGFEHNCPEPQVTRLHKLYLLPDCQGKSLGKLLMDEVVQQALQQQSKRISLNVNKYNPALGFYKKMQFEVVADEKLPIGEGFFMDDFVMERQLH